jgi:hypothetical protein
MLQALLTLLRHDHARHHRRSLLEKGQQGRRDLGTVAGCVIVTLGTFFIKLPLGLSALSWGLIVNTILYIVVSNATKVPDEIVDKYITRVTNYISAGNDVNAIVSNTILASTFRPEQLSGARNNSVSSERLQADRYYTAALGRTARTIWTDACFQPTGYASSIR